MSLDFAILRKITGGDAMLESELFGVFLDSAKECLTLLHEAHNTNDDLAWRGHFSVFDCSNKKAIAHRKSDWPIWLEHF